MQHNDDLETVQSCLLCGEATARHYLSIFDNNVERAIQVVLTYGHDPDWWGHPAKLPKRPESQGSRGEQSNTMLSIANEEPNDRGDRSGQRDDDETINTSQSGETETPTEEYPSWNDVLDDDGDANRFLSPDDIRTDLQFYNRYFDLVHGFVDAVCSNERKHVLRTLVSEADTKIASDSGMLVDKSGLIDRLSYKHDAEDGRSPLSYAVAKNMKQQVYNLLELGADIGKAMPPEGMPHRLQHTALTIAATNQKRDGTEMVRILLSKGANPEDFASAGVEEESLGRGMRYWIDKSRRLEVPNREIRERLAATLPPMDRLHEMDYAVVGQESAVAFIQEALAARFGNREGNRGPLVLLLLGPPGHGKTYFSSNTARSLVGEDNFLFVPCQSIRDDADLFGSRLGGTRRGSYSSDGKLTSFLRDRQGEKCVVFLDEFEKMKDLHSALGWNQAKKIYQSFLEPWNDGTLSDRGAVSGGNSVFGNGASSVSSGGNKIDCSQSIWILTSNWGQDEILGFSEEHKSRVYHRITEKDVDWIQEDLATKILRPLCLRNLKRIGADLEALSRRIDGVVPFLPFTLGERGVVADIALTERFALYREPCVLTGPDEERRSIGNLFPRGTGALAAWVARFYAPVRGASGMLASVRRIDGKFQMMYLRNQLGLSDAQNRRIASDEPPRDATEEPTFWVHYDTAARALTVTQSRPVGDDDDDDERDTGGNRLATGSVGEEWDACGWVRAERSIYAPGAADDAF